jgi:hypothetical protein
MLKSLRSRADLRFAAIANCRAFLAGGFLLRLGRRFQKLRNCDETKTALLKGRQRGIPLLLKPIPTPVFVSRMPMRQFCGCVDNAFNKCSDCYQQSYEKEHRMYRNPETDCESNQQSCVRWFENREQHFFHNASFSVSA